MASGWSWHLANGAYLVADLGRAEGRTVNWKLDGPGEASFELDANDPVASLVTELVTDVVVSYNGDRKWRGRVGPTTDTSDGTSDRLNVTAVEYGAVLGRRLTTVDYTETSKPSDRAWQALAAIQSRPAGNLGITRGAVAPGTARSLQSEWGETIQAIIERWGLLFPGGFDLWIDGDLMFQTASFRGTERDWPLSYGQTVTKFTASFDPGAYANVIRASGADGVPPVVVEVPDLATRPEGRWETQVGDTNLTTTDEVQAMAEAELSRRSVIASDFTFTIAPGAWTPDVAWIGDLTRISIKAGRRKVDTLDRIQEITVTDNTAGSTDVTISTGTDFRRDLAQLIRRNDTRLTDVVRR